MQVKSIAESSKGSILQSFWPSLSYYLLLRSLFCLILSGCLRHVLLYWQLFCGVRRLAVRWIFSLKWDFFTTKKDWSTGPTAYESYGPYFEILGQWPGPTINLKAWVNGTDFCHLLRIKIRSGSNLGPSCKGYKQTTLAGKELMEQIKK